MKGLTLNYLDRKPEAYELVRAGLKYDLRSHVCWHVYGLLYRSDREYREAIKCYANALRLDKGNQQILRDMAWLQVQMRDRSGLVETRRQLLTQKAGAKANWLGFSVAAHLDGRHRLAVHILEAYEKTLAGEPHASEAYEHSEMILYKLQLLEEGGSPEAALALLQREDARLVDRVSARGARVRLLNRLGRTEEAISDLEKLISINPEDTENYADLLDAHALPHRAADRSAAQEAALDALYERLAEVHPNCGAIQRTLLDWKEGEDFLRAADRYARRFVQGGIPSLFTDLKPLYANSAKQAALEGLMLSYLEALQAGGQLPPTPRGGTEAKCGAGLDSPAALVWVQAYLARHYTHLGQLERALEHVDAAIQHTPTALDLYLDKAHIMASMGAAGAAAFLADHARQMDLADRYINCEAVKLMFRAGRAEEAESTAALFTKDGDQLNNLFDMQAMWYELEYGRAYRRAGDLGKALKKFHAVFQHFEDIHEDQFDFHAYCLRKVTLGSYVAMLRMEDSLYEHNYYREAAWEAAGCYLALADNPPRTEEDERREEEAVLASMSAAERKKYRAKKRKEEALREKDAEEAKARAEKEAKKAREGEGGGKKGANAANATPKDTDPDGKKLMRAGDPLKEASKFLAVLEKCREQFANTHLLAFEVALRRGHLLLALRAAGKARDLAKQGGDAGGPAEEAGAHLAAVRLALQAATFKGHATVEALLKEGVATLLGGKKVADFNIAFLQGRGAESLECRVSAAEGLVAINAARDGEAVALLVAPSGELAPAAAGFVKGGGASQKACLAARQALAGPLKAEAAAGHWAEACRAAFPHSDHFREEFPGPKSFEKLVTFANAFEQLEIV